MLPVIACLDGTEKDSRAVAVATAVATLADADLHLIRIIDVPSERWVGQAMAVDSADDVAAVRRDAAAQLSDVIAGISLQTARRASFEVLEASDIAAAIIEHALQREARVVVMATRAAGAVGRATVGSVADRVVRESPRPVVVVPPGAEYLGGKTVQFGRVLVPQDGSSLAFRALEFLIELPHASELEFVLIEVVSREHDCMAAETRLKNSAA